MIRRVLITGDRNGFPEMRIHQEIRMLIQKYGENGLIVIGGGAPGVDIQCELACKKFNVHFARVDALWSTRHRSAGPQRNKAMLMLEPHEYIAFHEDITKSKGTKDMLSQLRKAGITGKIVAK